MLGYLKQKPFLGARQEGGVLVITESLTTIAKVVFPTEQEGYMSNYRREGTASASIKIIRRKEEKGDLKKKKKRRNFRKFPCLILGPLHQRGTWCLFPTPKNKSPQI